MNKIKEHIKKIQRILVDDVYIPMESAKEINNELKIILLLLEKEEKKNGSTS